uniref:Uncharacterized protein n=1 Tax=Eutreptiella gymnastica TaxID=73025 RepID=A0A7S4GG74_9EUGL
MATLIHIDLFVWVCTEFWRPGSKITLPPKSIWLQFLVWYESTQPKLTWTQNKEVSFERPTQSHAPSSKLHGFQKLQISPQERPADPPAEQGTSDRHNTTAYGVVIPNDIRLFICNIYMTVATEFWRTSDRSVMLQPNHIWQQFRNWYETQRTANPSLTEAPRLGRLRIDPHRTMAVKGHADVPVTSHVPVLGYVDAALRLLLPEDVWRQFTSFTVWRETHIINTRQATKEVIQMTAAMFSRIRNNATASEVDMKLGSDIMIQLVRQDCSDCLQSNEIQEKPAGNVDTSISEISALDIDCQHREHKH